MERTLDLILCYNIFSALLFPVLILTTNSVDMQKKYLNIYKV